MRDDQIVRLAELQEKLMDVLLEEGDPDTWAGAGKAGSKLTRAERGDRVWDKKNATATATVLGYIHSIQRALKADAPPPDAEENMADVIERAKVRAQAAMRRVLTKARDASAEG